MDVRYSTQVRVVGGRQGHAESEDGLLRVDLATPKVLGGSGEGTNPEQLFAAGFGACFESSVRGAARRKKITITESSVDAQVALAKEAEETSYSLRVDLAVTLPGVEPSVAEELLAEAKRNCPYSRAVRGNVDVTVRLVGVEQKTPAS
jgi:Ohr subfamily peroxiredoxin